MPSVSILALPNCLLTAVIGPLEIFAIANSLAVPQQGKKSTPSLFSPVYIAGVSRLTDDTTDTSTLASPATSTNFTGLQLPTQVYYEDTHADIIIIPPVFDGIDQITANTRLISWLKKQHDKGSIIATCCAGSFLLAETGLLDHKAATTHWQLTDKFRNTYPQVDLQPKQMLIDGGHYICAGGAMAWQDLALHIIARFMGPETASRCAKILVMDGTRHVQTPYFMFDQHSQDITGHRDTAIDTVQKWMQENYHQPVQLEALARIAQTTPRTLLRRFKKATGQSPLHYLQQLRIEAARHLLEVSNKNIEEITALTGYTDSSSFRRLFKKKTGLTPKEYRARFNRLMD